MATKTETRGAARKAGGFLWITRMLSAGEDAEVATIGYTGDGAEETISHARRVLAGAPQGSEDLEPGDLIVALLDANGDTDGDPLRVPSAQADWFLDEWLKVPDGWRSATPTPEAPHD